MQGQLILSGSDLVLSGSELALVLAPLADDPLVELSAPLQLSMTDFAALSQYVEQDIPFLGRVEAGAQPTYRESILTLTEIDAALSDEDLSLSLQGEIDDVFELADVKLAMSFADIPLAALLPLVMENFHYPGELGGLKGAAQIVSNAGRWDVESFELQSQGAEKSLALDFKGGAADVLGAPDLKLAGKLALSDRGLLEQLTGLRMAPLVGELSVSANLGAADLGAALMIGQSKL